MSLKKRRISSTLDNLQKQEFLYKGPNHAANLNDMRLKDKWCDVTIKVDGKEIKAHKVILAANLKYFETMFSSDSFHESQAGVITMESVVKADLELFVSYAYTGEILLTHNNALNLLELANYLSEDDIKKACIEFLEKNLNVEQACRAYKFANRINCLSLKNVAKMKILTNFGDCSKSIHYLLFDSESLMDILSDGTAQSIQTHKMLFEGVMKWIVHDAKKRKAYMEDLLSFIDVTELKAGDVTSCLYKNLLNRNDEYGITKDAIFYYEACKMKRAEQEQVLIVIDRRGSFQFYNFIEKKWSSLLKVSDDDDSVYWSSAVLNDKLYCISEISEEFSLQVFDPLSNQFTALNSSSNILTWPTLCACSRFLYLCGGVTEDSMSGPTPRYDPQTNLLETLAPMSCDRWATGATLYQGCLYVLGGNNGKTYLKLVEKYDPVRNEWTTLAPMHKKRCGPKVAVLDEKLYVCGGRSGGAVIESSVEVYDQTTNSWQLIASMNKKRSSFLLVARKGKLLAIGGEGEMTVEVYDASKDQWQMDDEMSSGLQVDCCVGGLIPFRCIVDT